MNRVPAVGGCDREKEETMEYESESDSSESDSLDPAYPCPLCHNNFIKQEEFIDHMEICSETDQDIMKQTCPYWQQTFEIIEEFEEHYRFHYSCSNNWE